MLTAKGVSGMAATASAIHHIGMSVANIDDALAFWEPFLGIPARWRKTLDRPYLGAIVGIPSVSIKAAFIDLPGGAILELLDYQEPSKRSNPDATSNPGNVHLCLAVEDANTAWNHAVGCAAPGQSSETGPSRSTAALMWERGAPIFGFTTASRWSSSSSRSAVRGTRS
jgi:hypothetical protein